MRRCPHCESPNPDPAPVCAHCARPLAPPPRAPFLRLDDVWNAAALRRAGQALALLLAFRLSFGALLSVGAQRVEARFLAFHLAHGLLLGAGLAWVRGVRGPKAWAAWILVGLAGGVLAEALEVWYTYRHLMGTLTYYAFDWFGLPSSPALIYQILQGLRLLGVAGPLLLLALAGEKRFSRGLTAVFLFALALGLRVPLRGAFLSWPALAGSAQAWSHLGLYAASALCLLYGLGQRALTKGPDSR